MQLPEIPSAPLFLIPTAVVLVHLVEESSQGTRSLWKRKSVTAAAKAQSWLLVLQLLYVRTETCTLQLSRQCKITYVQVFVLNAGSPAARKVSTVCFGHFVAV
eukprot:SAG31_NODE_1124_length_9772_cov_11.331541_10_plen_103_part_00